MSASLTDRYVYAVARSLPEARRDDVERELRATIADDIDARVEGGADPATAERAVLETLGDPARLVAGYLDRPLHLIGPAYYLTWVRLFRLLLIVVLPFVAAAVVLGQLIAGTPVGGIVGSTIGVLITVAVHLGFWTGFVFWILERSEARTQARTEVEAWTVGSLPTPPEKGVPTIVEAVTVTAFVALFIAAIVGQQFASGFFDESGRVIPILLPELWAWQLPLAILLLAAEVGLAFWLAASRRWAFVHVVVNILLAIAAVALVLALIAGPGLFNPEWFAQFGAGGDVPPLHIANVITAVTVVGVGLWDSIDGVVTYARGRRA